MSLAFQPSLRFFRPLAGPNFQTQDGIMVSKKQSSTQIMIRGCFYHDVQESPRFAISVLSERCHVYQLRTSHDLKQLYSKETMSSATIGSKDSKAVYCSHMSGCSGTGCACHNAVSHFLTQAADADDLGDYVNNNWEYLEENIKYPYMMIFVKKSSFLVLTSFAARDFKVAKLEPGLYDIRDCFISNVTPKTYEEVSLLYEYWVMKKLGSYEFADAVTEHLKSRLLYFPNNCEVDAHGITLLYNHHDEATYFHCSEHKARPVEKEGIKGPVSQYNFFAMESRKNIRDDCRAAEMSNNEWNRLLGQRWRNLSPADHEPFKLMALQDKKRFASECAAAGIIVEKRVKQTAYNHFVHQEKQFVASTNISNLKHNTGKHCSARWKAMDPAEKRLFLTLEQTG